MKYYPTSLIKLHLEQRLKISIKRSGVRQDIVMWAQRGLDWTQMGQIWELFSSADENVLKSDLKKSQICHIWGQSDPI